jgi:putative flippase GtrA
MLIRPYYQSPSFARIDKGMLFRYMSAGALTTFTDYAAFTIVFSYANGGLLAATVIAYVAGLIVSYFLNRYFVFSKGADRQSAATSLWRYAVFLGVNLVITYIILWALEQVGITPYLGKLVVGAFMFFWIYWGNQAFVFRGEKTGPIQL